MPKLPRNKHSKVQRVTEPSVVTVTVTVPAHFDDIGFRFCHMSSARSTSDGRGPVTRKEFRIGRSQGNLARTPDVAVDKGCQWAAAAKAAAGQR